MSQKPFPVLRSGVPALLLAPMEGITDAPMRALIAERGGFAFCVSEFLRVSQEVPPAHVFRRDIPELSEGCMTPSGVPVQIQLLGGDPERMAMSALRAFEIGAQAIDINFGCPAPTVNRHDGGATLLKFPDRIREVVAAIRAALPAHVPVSAKLRLGWDDMDSIYENSEKAAEGGAAWITIHGRTRMQGYTPPAYWKPIGEVRKRLNIPVVANGEIWTIENFRRCREETGCEHFMLGRGALADPSLPLRVAAELGLGFSGTPVQGENPVDWLPLVRRFAEHITAFPDKPPSYTVRRVKQWLKYASLKGRISWFDSVKTIEGLEEMFGYLSTTTG